MSHKKATDLEDLHTLPTAQRQDQWNGISVGEHGNESTSDLSHLRHSL